jgi:methanogenic corrinoid protein MtbC1
MNASISIKLAAQRTGLSAHVIRIWEKRYSAVTPGRSGTQRRLYTEAEIARLKLLGLASKAGHRIGDIVNYSNEELSSLVTQAELVPSVALPESSFLEQALEAVRNYDSAGLEKVFDRAAVRFGQHGLLTLLVAPLAHSLGDLWSRGELTAAQEHFASNLLRSQLLRFSGVYAEDTKAPLLIVTTPAGQLHELGAALVAAAARNHGWRVAYLGASLPAPEIAGAAIQRAASAVALSIVHPGDDPSLEGELELLRKLLPANVALLAGGRAALCYDSALLRLGIHCADNLDSLGSFLESLRMKKRMS